MAPRPPGRPEGAAPSGGKRTQRASGGSPWLREEEGALVLELHVQPGAKRTEVAGEHGGALKLRLAAPPVDGKANTELIRFLSDAFGVPMRSVTLLRGAASRSKRVRVEAPSRRPDREWARTPSG